LLPFANDRDLCPEVIGPCSTGAFENDRSGRGGCERCIECAVWI
jgi:hypothetical protein